MTQNVISLALSADQLAEVNKALDALEKHLADLISLSVDDRSELRKMGPKSEMFARKAYDVLAQSPEILPGTFELADFTVDLEALASCGRCSPGSRRWPGGRTTPRWRWVATSIARRWRATVMPSWPARVRRWTN